MLHMFVKYLIRVLKQFDWFKKGELVDYLDEFFSPKSFVNTFTIIICACSADQLIGVFRFALIRSTSW